MRAFTSRKANLPASSAVTVTGLRYASIDLHGNAGVRRTARASDDTFDATLREGIGHEHEQKNVTTQKETDSHGRADAAAVQRMCRAPRAGSAVKSHEHQ